MIPSRQLNNDFLDNFTHDEVLILAFNRNRISESLITVI